MTDIYTRRVQAVPICGGSLFKIAQSENRAKFSSTIAPPGVAILQQEKFLWICCGAYRPLRHISAMHLPQGGPSAIL